MPQTTTSAPLQADTCGYQALDAAVRELDLAEVARQPARMALALGQVGRCYGGLGDAPSAAWYLRQALRWARTLGAADASIELLCDLAETCAELADTVGDNATAEVTRHQAQEQCRDHGFEATRLAQRSADPQWEVTVLLRVSEALDRCGDHEDAIAMQCRALALITGVAVENASEPRKPARRTASPTLN